MATRIIADTVSGGSRIVSVEADIPTWMLGQVGKHRAFSLSAQSARAVPIESMINDVPNWRPTFHGQPGRKKAKGMRDGEPLPEDTRRELQAVWAGLYANTVAAVRRMACISANAGYGVSKGELNRFLSPFKMSRIILTGLVDSHAWEWLFKLRIHPDSQSEFHALASECRSLIESSTPAESDYHVPYREDLRATGIESLQNQILCSIALCATVSYRVSDITTKKAARIARKLANEGHWVPFEHVCVIGDAVADAAKAPRSLRDLVLQPYRGNHYRCYGAPQWLQARKFYDDHVEKCYPASTLFAGRELLGLNHLFEDKP